MEQEPLLKYGQRFKEMKVSESLGHKCPRLMDLIQGAIGVESKEETEARKIRLRGGNYVLKKGLRKLEEFIEKMRIRTTIEDRTYSGTETKDDSDTDSNTASKIVISKM